MIKSSNFKGVKFHYKQIGKEIMIDSCLLPPAILTEYLSSLTKHVRLQEDDGIQTGITKSPIGIIKIFKDVSTEGVSYKIQNNKLIK